MHLGRTLKPRILLSAAAIAFIAATAIAYWPGLHGPFLYDDNTNIVSNNGIVLASLAPQDLLRAAFSTRSGPLYRPISMLSFALNDYLFGPGVFSFKLTNLVIHLINGLLILWLTRTLMVNCRRRYRFEWPDAAVNWASVLIAAAWLLHPLNLTGVLYVVQRMTSLAALFTLAAMLAYVHGRARSLVGKTGWPLVWLLTPLLGVLGILSKEDAALLPLYLLIIEWLVFGFRDQHGKTAKDLLIYFFGGVALPVTALIVFLIVNPGWLLGGYVIRDFTLGERLLTELRVTWLYIQWTFVPDIRQLALYHDDLKISTGLLSPISTLWSLLALIAPLVIAVWQRKRRPLLSLGILWFFAGQMMESTMLPLMIAFEHRNYLPDYGLLLAAFGLLLLPAAGRAHELRLSLRWTLAVLTLPVLFSATLLRASEWKNLFSFSYYEALHHPRSPHALYALGQVYSNLALSGEITNPGIALRTLKRAAAVSTDIIPDTAMMLVSAKLKLPVDPGWAKHAEDILHDYPVNTSDTAALDSLVNCLPTDCKRLMPAADSMLQAAFASTKRFGPNADLWVIYSNYLTFTGHPLSEVISAMQQSAKLEPQVPQYRINLAKGYIVTGDFKAAEHQIQVLSHLNLLGSQDYDIRQLKNSLSAARAAANKPKHASR